ncbi:hypothetical protein D3C71_79500 [compost metagenome]
MTSSDIIDHKVKELKNYIDLWARDLKAELGIPATGSTIGVSYEPSIQLDRLPDELVIRAGMYQPRNYNPVQVNILERVEVIEDSHDDVVTFRTFYSTNGNDKGTMTVSHFQRLYEPVERGYSLMPDPPAGL